MSERFALYFTLPQQDELYKKVALWFGHDAYDTSTDLTHHDQLPIALSAFQKHCQKASHYGFHATLKPPFKLQSDTSLEDLEYNLQQFAEKQKIFECKPLEIKKIGQFLALKTQEKCHTMNQLANDCVETFEPFRTPLTEKEVQAREPSCTSLNQYKQLAQWGYPFVMDEFRFHMTLTNQLDSDIIDACQHELNHYLKPHLTNKLLVDKIYLFHQKSKLHKFEIINSFSFENRTHKYEQ